MHAKGGMLIGRLHLQNDVRVLPELASIWNDRCSGRLVVVVVKGCVGASLRLDLNLEAKLLQSGDGLRRPGDAAFARAGLFRNGNLHRYCGLVLDAPIRRTVAADLPGKAVRA